MEKIKVLNLYAGIGGNRKLWSDEEIEVTAIEINPEIAKIYQDFFPNDKVMVADAHQYLLEHFEEYDFIWSSPPCPTHSKLNKPLFAQQRSKEQARRYPNMELYQEIIFLKHYFKGKWVVENVIGYYDPLIKPFKSGCHYFWSNFIINDMKEIKKEMNSVYGSNQTKWGFSLKDKKITHRKDQILNNMVNPKLALNIFKCAFKEKQKTLLEEKEDENN
jgi:DNA (cytosine-5)-methyltransferase 1